MARIVEGTAAMPEDTIEISVRMADRGEVGYRMVSASISSREGSVAGAPVVFTIEVGPGTLASTGGRERTVASDEWGIAEVNWYPEQHPRSSPEADVTQTVTIKAVCESDVVGRSRDAMREYQGGILADYAPYTHYTDKTFQKLAALKPKTLAIMHGSSFTGDGERALRDLAVAFKDIFGGK